MSKARSPRAVCSTTMGTRAIFPPYRTLNCSGLVFGDKRSEATHEHLGPGGPRRVSPSDLPFAETSRTGAEFPSHGYGLPVGRPGNSEAVNKMRGGRRRAGDT